MRAYIVEDEAPALRRLEEFLSDIQDVEVIGTSGLAREAAREIEKSRPDLIFLDIELGDISGIDMLRLLSYDPMVVFTTAYDQYAIQAFELEAIDYLLKPFTRERLAEAVEKVRDRLSIEEASTEGLKKLLANWGPKQDHLTRIPSRIGDKIYILADEDIVYISSENKLVFAFLKNSKYLLNYTLDELQNRLDPDKFFRIHRSTIVNLNYIKTIEAWFGGGYKMKVKDGRNTELSISRSAGKLLREKLGW